jgi:predicted glycosyltransferase
MGGYHTTAEALAADRRALIVPSAAGRPDQRIRAERLRELGAVDVLPMPALTPATLGAWVADGPRSPSRLTGVIDTDGLSRLPMLLDELRTPLEDVAQRRFRRGARFAERRLATAPELAASAAG